MVSKTTLSDIENIESDCLTPQQVSDILKVSNKTFLKAALSDHNDLGFPIIKVGQRIKIPKEPFLKFMKGK